MSAKNHFLNSGLHLLIAFVLCMKGSLKFPYNNLLGGLMILFGLVVLAYFIYMVTVKRESRTMHIVIHLFEGLAALFTAYIFYDEGKKYLPFVFILAAIGFFISVFIFVRKHPIHKA